ncbi:MAG TPA: protein rep [Bacteroidia bacterium]|nr:protein rep [Bacteroidia bacterium]
MVIQSNSGEFFNTLAQTGTAISQKGGIFLSGNGTDLSDEKTRRSKGKKKLVSQHLSFELMEIANEKGNSKLEKTFRNTYYCMDRVHVAEGRMYGKYCKNRLCTTCLGIRKADIVNKYLPVIQTWPEPYFVTLTVKAVSASRLRDHMRSMLKGLKKIISKHRKQYQRGTGKKLVGIHSLECNFNPVTRTYNPHFHFLVPDKETASLLLEEWIAYSKNHRVSRNAQDMRRVHSNEACLVEIVKYGSKIFTEVDATITPSLKNSHKIYLKALYTIVEAMQSLRLFDRFGFNLPQVGQRPEALTTYFEHYQQGYYDTSRATWVETSSGQSLMDYTPNPSVTYLLENCLDTLNC